jgi:hypothetical protein
MLALPQEVHRVTMDIDYTLRRGMSMSVTECLREMCAVQPDLQDGMSYSLVTDGKDAPRVIREDSINPTVRAKLVATLHCTRPAERRFVVDVTEAELEYEPVIRVWRPTLKGFDPLEVPAYPWEIVMAEKLHTIMTGSIANPRLRDYMDVIALVREGVADMDHVGGWLDKVFEARGDAGKQFEEAISFTHEFAEKRQDDWAATLGRTGYSGTMPTTMAAAIDEVREIALLLTSSRTPSRVP